jgi:hypothetical protein
MFDPVGATIGAVGLGGSLVGGYMAKRGADKAANTAAAASDRANELQYDIWREQQALLSPWAQSGNAGLTRLNYAMYGQTPTADSMMLDPYSAEYQNYFEAHPNSEAQTLYRNPITGEISETAPGFNTGQMGVEGGSLDPSWRFGMQDWYDSPEYQVYNQARDVSIRQGQDAVNAQSAARGMFGSGTWANSLAGNISDQYAKYNPASLAAARGATEAARAQQYNMMVGMASPTGAQQVANYAGQYGANAGNLMQAAGNAQAQGQQAGTNAMVSGFGSGVNQIANAYGNYQGQQNFNALLAQLQAAKMGGGGNYNQYGQMGNSGYAINFPQV